MTAGPHRRGWLAAMGALWVAACDKLNESKPVSDALGRAEGLTRKAQRLVTDRKALAREFTPADISPDFKANGTLSPPDAEYIALRDAGFAGYALTLDGLVEQPLTLSVADLRAAPSRTQITRHDCVEGWSSIGKWRGARLGQLLDRARLKPEARYIVFHCADTLDAAAGAQGKYYESIDLIDAYHPQTILAYDMNDAPLAVKHGAPLRLRVERQLGYKQAKYIMRIEAVADYAHISRGGGGFWEDRGYEWYAGI